MHKAQERTVAQLRSLEIRNRSVRLGRGVPAASQCRASQANSSAQADAASTTKRPLDETASRAVGDGLPGALARHAGLRGVAVRAVTTGAMSRRRREVVVERDVPDGLLRRDAELEIVLGDAVRVSEAVGMATCLSQYL